MSGPHAQPIPWQCELLIPSGGSLTATLRLGEHETVNHAIMLNSSDMYYLIDCTSDPAPLVNFVNTISDNNTRPIFQSILSLPAQNPVVNSFAVLYGLVTDDKGRYIIGDGHTSAIII